MSSKKENKDWALDYHVVHGFSVVPGKEIDGVIQPIVRWTQYQEKKPTIEEINSWWNNGEQLVIITGKLSGITVMDIDSEIIQKTILELLPKNFKCPMVKSPRGWHYYFKYNPNVPTRQIKNGPEFKNDGGCITAPPTVRSSFEYRWMDGQHLEDVFLPEMPQKLIDFYELKPQKFGPQYDKRDLSFNFHNRDNTIFSIINCLAKGGMPEAQMEKIALRLADTCDPPFPENEALEKVGSAIKRIARKERNLADEIKSWIYYSSGWFKSDDIYKSIDFLTPQDKRNINVIIHRLSEEGFVKKHRDKYGMYRKYEYDIEPIKLDGDTPPALDLEFPLDLNSLGIRIYPKSIIVIAGDANSGKTTWLLNFISKNMDKFKINYFSSEMGEEEIKLSLSCFPIKTENWKFKAYERSDNFEDVIRPDEINIFDYYESRENFWEIGGILKDIYDKLNQGIAIIAIQKKPEKVIGEGGGFGLRRPRLYISMWRDRIMIYKAKRWTGGKDPNRMCKRFQIEKGYKFIEKSAWFYADVNEAKNLWG